MGSNLVRLSVLFVLLAITPQISSAVTSPGSGQNTILDHHVIRTAARSKLGVSNQMWERIPQVPSGRRW